MTYTQMVEMAADVTRRVSDFLADDLSDLDLAHCDICGSRDIAFRAPATRGPEGWSSTCRDCGHYRTWTIPAANRDDRLPGEQPAEGGAR